MQDDSGEPPGLSRSGLRKRKIHKNKKSLPKKEIKAPGPTLENSPCEARCILACGKGNYYGVTMYLLWLVMVFSTPVPRKGVVKAVNKP